MANKTIHFHFHLHARQAGKTKDAANVSINKYIAAQGLNTNDASEKIPSGYINLGGKVVKNTPEDILKHVQKTFPNVKKVDIKGNPIFDASVSSVEREIATHKKLMQAFEKHNKPIPAEMVRKLKFLEEELDKAKVNTSDASESISLSKVLTKFPEAKAFGLARVDYNNGEVHTSSHYDLPKELAAKIEAFVKSIATVKDAEALSVDS